MHLEISATTLDIEPHLYQCLRYARRFCKKISVVVELGANDCVETVGFAQELPSARIFTFECNPDTLPICRERVRPYKNIRLMEVAVGEEAGVIDFYKTARTAEDWNTGASSRFRINASLVELAQEKIQVPMTTLKQALAPHKVEHIDILWMDLQGGELGALKGLGEELLGNTTLIFTEVEHVPLYEGQPLFRDVRKYLEKRGFRLLTYANLGRNFNDVIFINERVHRPLLPAWLIIGYFTAKERVTGKLRVIRQRVNKRL
jgi:FkbM family methyltransferase